MYGSRENEKKSEFVAKTKALRDQRAEEKSRERAAVKIQVRMLGKHLFTACFWVKSNGTRLVPVRPVRKLLYIFRF